MFIWLGYTVKGACNQINIPRLYRERKVCVCCVPGESGYGNNSCRVCVRAVARAVRIGSSGRMESYRPPSLKGSKAAVVRIGYGGAKFDDNDDFSGKDMRSYLSRWLSHVFFDMFRHLITVNIFNKNITSMGFERLSNVGRLLGKLCNYQGVYVCVCICFTLFLFFFYSRRLIK